MRNENIANTLLLTSSTENRKCAKCSNSMAANRIQFSRCPDDSCPDSSASRNVGNGMRLHSNSTTNWSSGLWGEAHRDITSKSITKVQWPEYMKPLNEQPAQPTLTISGRSTIPSMSSQDIFRCICRKMFLPKSHMTRISIQGFY